MATFTKFYQFACDLASGLHALGSDSLNVMLTNTAPAQTVITKGAITEISAGNGYTAGGAALTRTFSAINTATVGNVYQLSLQNTTFTASGAGMATFRYPVLYNQTKYAANNTANVLIGFWDYGSSVTLAAGETFTVGFDAANGVIQLG
jgi:hypothetical protein